MDEYASEVEDERAARWEQSLWLRQHRPRTRVSANAVAEAWLHDRKSESAARERMRGLAGKNRAVDPETAVLATYSRDCCVSGVYLAVVGTHGVGKQWRA